MAKTAREKFVLAIFPAMIIVIAYVWLSARPNAVLLDAAEADLERAHNTVPPIQKLSRLTRESDVLADQIDAKTAELERLAVASAESAASNRGDRNKALQRLTSIMSSNNLMLLDSTRLDDSPFVSKDMQALEKDIAAARGQKLQFWRMSVVGSFSAMLSVLKGLSGGDDLIVPVSIDMEPADEAENLRAWTLTVWL